jgi:tight adherence protein B
MPAWILELSGWFFMILFGVTTGWAAWQIQKRLAVYMDEDRWVITRLHKLRPDPSRKEAWHAHTLRKLDLAHVEFNKQDSGLLQHMDKMLRRCGPTMSWIRFALMFAGCCVVWMIVLWITRRAQGINILIVGVMLGGFTAWQWVLIIGNKRDDAFLGLFPEVLETMIRSVRAGATIDRALRIVGDKIREPFGSLFQTMSKQMQVGVPMNHVLKQTAEAIMIDDFRFFAIVLVIQQETGGALADVLNKLANLIRARHELRLKMHALTSESRTSAIIVGALPVGFGLILHVLSPGHFAPFFQNPTGQTLFNSALGLLGFGFFVLWKMTQIKV